MSQPEPTLQHQVWAVQQAFAFQYGYIRAMLQKELGYFFMVFLTSNKKRSSAIGRSSLIHMGAMMQQKLDYFFMILLTGNIKRSSPRVRVGLIHTGAMLQKKLPSTCSACGQSQQPAWPGPGAGGRPHLRARRSRATALRIMKFKLLFNESEMMRIELLKNVCYLPMSLLHVLS